MDADEVVNLRPKKRGLLMTLILSALTSLWLSLKEPRKTEEPEQKQVDIAEAEEALDRAADAAETEAIRLQVAKTVREIMEENGITANEGDVELKRIVSSFLLLRDQGYTLRVLPGTPEENAPAFDFEGARGEQAA